MVRLPTPGSDHGTWGEILNEFLLQSLKTDGTLQENVVTSNNIAPNSVTNTALATNAVNATIIADGTITESLLDPTLQSKINTPESVTSVAGKTGDITLLKSDVGLSNVDNTSDFTKNTTAATLTNKTLADPTINAYTEGVVAVGVVTTACSLSIVSGTVLTATLTPATTCVFTMPTPVAGKSFTLLLKQDASAGNGAASFTSVKWGAGGAPVITTDAGKMDILSFFSDGVNWYGQYAQGYTP